MRCSAPRALVLVALAGAVPAGCDRGPSEPPPQPLVMPQVPTADVVDAALASVERQEPPAPLEAEALDEVEGLLGFVAGARGDLARAGREDLWRLGPGVAPHLGAVALDPERAAGERAAALSTLGDGDPALVADPLLRTLTEAEAPWVRGSAAWYLGELDGDGWVPDAVLRLKYETDESVVVYLSQALAKHGVLAGLPGLVTIRDGGRDPAQRAAAGAVLDQLAAEHAGGSVEELVRLWRAARALPTLAEPDAAFEAAVWRWIDRLAEWQLRPVDDARFVLVALGRLVAPELALALGDDDPYVRLHACQCLERMGTAGAAAADELARRLFAPDLGPHAAVALGAVTVGTDAGSRHLLPLVEDTRVPPALRLGAARGLSRTGDPTVAERVRALFARTVGDWDELAQARAEAALACGPGPEQAAFAAACLERPGLEPSSSGAALEAWLESTSEANGAVLERWREVGARRGPDFDEAAMWSARRRLVEEALAADELAFGA